MHPCASIPRRAEQLKASILRQLSNGNHAPAKLILIAHSLGGLDARYMLSHLGMADHIAALLTITTPHRGASLADLCLKHLNRRFPLYAALRATGLDIGAATDVTRPAMAAFNAATPDHPAVRYFSVTCSPANQIRPKYRLIHAAIARLEGENDGTVAVASARWGTHLAHWPVDHVQALNRHPLMYNPRTRPDADIPQRYVAAVQQVQEALDQAESART